MKDENLEFKFASSHKKSVQGMIPVEAASGRRFLWSWDSNGEIRVWDTKVRSLPAPTDQMITDTTL